MAPTFKMFYNKEGDVVYVDLTSEQAAYSKPFGDNRVVDYSSHGNPVGIEFTDVSAGIDPSDMPYEKELTQYLASQGAFKIYAYFIMRRWCH